MRKIFIDDKVIIFCDSATCDDMSAMDESDGIDITKVLQNLENSKHITIKAIDAEAAYTKFSALLKPVESAGGLVENSRGEILMIFRNGRWDLPKGHVEEYESFAECACREVEEECGVRGLAVTEKLVVTEHIYRWNTKLIHKFSHWFRMSIDPRYENMTLKPQLEEGIVSAEWVARGEVSERLKNGYQTILEVIQVAGIANKQTN